MIFFSIGFSANLADWCDAVLMCLAELRGSVAPVHIIRRVDPHNGQRISVLDEVTKHIFSCDAANLIVGVRSPDESLLDLLTEADVPFVLIFGDPRRVVTELCASGNIDFANATRAIANECALLMALAALRTSIVIRAEQVVNDPLKVIADVATHLNMSTSVEQIRRIHALLRPPKPHSNDWSLGIPSNAQKLIDGALGAYAFHFYSAGEPLADIVWHRHLFFRSVGGAPVDSVKLRDTNNGAFLVYGPYINLLPGHWFARLVIGMSPEAVGRPLIIDAFSGRQIASTIFSPREAGVFTIEMNLVLDENTCRNIEIRICVGKQNEPGEIAFGHVVLRPVSVQYAARPQEDFRLAFEL